MGTPVRRFQKALPLLIALGTLGACGSKPIYYWGDYEQVVYESTTAPGKTSPEKHIERLERDFGKAQKKGLPVNPGFHAQLGLLYLESGNVQEARKNFNAEMTKFPESAVLMKRF